MTLTHRTTVVTADDPSFPVGTDEWHENHKVTTDFSPETSGGATLGTSSLGWTSMFLNVDVDAQHYAFVARAGGGSGVENWLSGGQGLSFQVLGDLIQNSCFGMGRYSSGTGGARIVLAKSKSDTVGSQALVASGDLLGQIAFEGSDGNEFLDFARIQVICDGTPGLGDCPGRMTLETTPDGAGSPLVRCTIDKDGQVIWSPGSTTPASLTNNGDFTLTPTSNTNLRISYRGSDGVTRTGNITLS